MLTLHNTEPLLAENKEAPCFFLLNLGASIVPSFIRDLSANTIIIRRFIALFPRFEYCFSLTKSSVVWMIATHSSELKWVWPAVSCNPIMMISLLKLVRIAFILDEPCVECLGCRQ